MLVLLSYADNLTGAERNLHSACVTICDFSVTFCDCRLTMSAETVV